MTPPPGYADPNEPDRQPLAAPALFLAGTLTTLALAGYEVGVATPSAFAIDEVSLGALWLTLAGAAAGWLSVRRSAAQPSRVALALAAASLFSSLSGYAFTLAFAAGGWLPFTTLLVPALFGAAAGVAASFSLRGFGPTLAKTDGLALLLNPRRASLLIVLLIAVLLAFPQLGIVRRGALLGSLLAGGAALALVMGRWLALPSRALGARAWLIRAAPCLALAALAGAERVAPLPDVRNHRSGELLYVLDGPRGHHSFVKIQGGLVLFSDQLLALTSVDAGRFGEALVHPALGAVTRRNTVLVFDDGAGAVLRETLRWKDVARLTFVPSDPDLARLARSSAWLGELGATALADPRVVFDAREPAVFLLKSQQRYDVVLANFGDPTSYLRGKYYTVAVLSALRARLAPGGLLALQITSPERTPNTHASILKTLSAAGFSVRAYRAPLPTLGEWGFALAAPSDDAEAVRALTRASENASFPNGTALINSATIATLFAEPAVVRAATPTLNHLYDQPLVELYHSEERLLEE